MKKSILMIAVLMGLGMHSHAQTGEEAVSAEEKIHRMAQLENEIERISILRAYEPNSEERMRLGRQLSRLNATLGVYEAENVFQFEKINP